MNSQDYQAQTYLNVIKALNDSLSTVSVERDQLAKERNELLAWRDAQQKTQATGVNS